MTIKYILRPDNILTTPTLLKEGLNAIRTIKATEPTTTNRTVNPHRRNLSMAILANPSRTFFTCYHGTRINGFLHSELESSNTRIRPHSPTTSILSSLHTFFSKNKYEQRKEIGVQGICVPPSAITQAEANELPNYGLGFVSRPFHHRGGSGWNRVDSTGAWNGSGYLSPIFPKRFEFRVIFVLGRPLITLRKRVTERDPTVPWNHTMGSTFITVNDPNNNYITKYTDLVDRLCTLPIIMMSDLIGVDVMMNSNHEYQVCEFNTCPALTIENNLSSIIEYIQNNFEQHRETYY